MKKTVLYIGAFQLPDKNAAAFRVLANAKILKELQYEVVFLSMLNQYTENMKLHTNYDGFSCFAYKFKYPINYFYGIKEIVSIIKEIKADIVIAYNYPAVALNRLRKYCKIHHIKCIADVTEWYPPSRRGNLVFKMVKDFDTAFRMKYVHTRMDGVIAISSFLFDFYKSKTKTVKIPPLVDLNESKWSTSIEKKQDGLSLIYAGSPSAGKERLDVIVDVVENSNINFPVYLKIVGISKDEFSEMYNRNYNGDKVTFYGRIPNSQVIKMIKEANWVIVLRDNNKQVQAGFPTKISESISCGTPVIANRFSNISDYLHENNSIIIESISAFTEVTIKESLNHSTNVDKNLFDYRNYYDVMKELMDKIS